MEEAPFLARHGACRGFSRAGNGLGERERSMVLGPDPFVAQAPYKKRPASLQAENALIETRALRGAPGFAEVSPRGLGASV